MYKAPAASIGIWSRRLWKTPYLAAFLGTKALFRPRLPDQKHLADIAALAGLGLTPDAFKTKKLAEKRNLPYLTIDNGFLRCVGANAFSAPPCSLVIDSTGIYYDATRPSDLEDLLNTSGWETPELLAEAESAMRFMLRYGVSDHSGAPDAPPYHLTTPGKRLRVLILDQPLGDPGLKAGMASAQTFRHMLESAHAAHPGAALFIKPHPDTMASGSPNPAPNPRQGHLLHEARAFGATVLDKPMNTLSLLRQADIVYTVTAQEGFEALMLGKTVRCFGQPFYAGWGLTEDERRCPRRKKQRTVIELFAATFLLYSRHVNPVTGQACSLHDLLRILAMQRGLNERNAGYSACVGFSRRDHFRTRPFLASTHGYTEFFTSPAKAIQQVATHKGRVILREGAHDAIDLCIKSRTPFSLMGDGFLHSLGLAPASLLPFSQIRTPEEYGPTAAFHAPPVWRRPSINTQPVRHIADALENLLLALPPDLWTSSNILEKAAALRAYIVQRHQNQASTPGLVPSDFPPLNGSKRILLVPGEDAPTDLHTAKSPGTPPLSDAPSSLDVLRAVRAAHPTAYVVYTTFARPDTAHSARYLADTVIHARHKNWPGSKAGFEKNGENPAMPLLPRVHEVHTHSSIAGFAALLHGAPVFTYGSPFYAGWGLTEDQHLFPRRTRPLSLDMLTAGVLMLYPSYYDWNSGLVCGLEDILHVLHSGRPFPSWQTFLKRAAQRFASRLFRL